MRRRSSWTQQLAALLERRAQVVGMLTAEKNRHHQAVGRVRTLIEAHITWLQAALDELNEDLDQALQASPLWRARDDLLRSVPGVGPILSFTLLADLPELGRLTHKQLAALVGVAPLNRDSGTCARQTPDLGRTGARALRALHERVERRALQSSSPRLLDPLREQGKPPKVALVACMHKLLTILNAMVKHQTPWRMAPTA